MKNIDSSENALPLALSGRSDKSLCDPVSHFSIGDKKKVFRTYKYKLRFTKSQESTASSWIGACRFVHNLAKETKTYAYQHGVNLSKFDLMKQLPELKDVEWIKSVPAQSLYGVIERLDNSYQNYFRKLKSGEIAHAKNQYIAKRLSKGLKINEHKLANFGKPKWAKKDEYNSMVFKDKLAAIGNNIFKLPKLGEVKVFKDRPISGTIKRATIIKEPTGYFLCVLCEVEETRINNSDESQVIGIDMGITKFCATSQGKYIENERHFARHERKLRVANRSLDRKEKGSHRWEKQKKILSRLHNTTANVREDFLHKESTKMAKQFNTVFAEDLKISNMARNKNLSKHILDCGWGMFREMLDYKTNLELVNPKFTSQRCNECGYIAKENRKSQSKFECVKCGHTENADVNAAKNILSQGMAHIRQRKSVDYA